MKEVNYKDPLTWFALGFGSGLSPLAPGTVASFIAGLLFYYLFFPFFEAQTLGSAFLIYLIFLLICFFFGLEIYKRTMRGEKDAKIFVWDEFVGMWIACFPLILFLPPWPWILLCFVLFRIFDIWKPSLIGYFDRSEGVLGVMMDDVMAGFFSAIVVVGIFYFLLSLFPNISYENLFYFL